MPTTIKIKDLDIVYLSYDEPNCEENWADLQSKCPRAQRVHGVKGSDAAHKACAELAQTSRFITVDGDNKIRERFLNSEWQFDDTWDITDSVLSFPAENAVNGLQYGNGGIKVWPKHVVLNMRTHEAADDSHSDAGTDFCWVLDYVLMPGVWSDVHMNSTPAQAWRAGFREGVKLGLVEGLQVRDVVDWRQGQVKNNYDRLCTWLQVGMDAKNGFYAILGARMGLHRTVLTDWDASAVQDFDNLDYIWEKEVEGKENLVVYCQELGTVLAKSLALPIDAVPLNPAQSNWFKTVFTNPTRTQPKRLKG
jgi:hypothetical protein